jgi:outer membrane protein assembly factor BamB
MGGSVLCLSAVTGAVLWEHETGGPVESSPAVAAGWVYIGSDDGRLHCLNATTGVEIWNATTGGAIKSSPSVVGGRVYFGSNDFGVHCVDAGSGTPLWNFSTGGWVYSSPGIIGTRLYIGSCDGRLYCIDTLTGRPIWNRTAQYMPASPAVSTSEVIVGSYDNHLRAYNASDGTELWNVSGASSGIYSSAAVDGSSEGIGDAYFGDNNGTLFVVGLDRRAWPLNLGAGIRSSPMLLFEPLSDNPGDGCVVVGTEDGFLIAVNIKWHMGRSISGVRWHLKLGTSVSSSPFIYHNRIYVGAADGDAGVVACVGTLDPRYNETVITVEGPPAGAYVLTGSNVTFNTSIPVHSAEIVVGPARYAAVKTGLGWTATIGPTAPLGRSLVTINALGAGGENLGTTTLELFIRSPGESPPTIFIDSPRNDQRLSGVVLGEGRAQGHWPVLKVEARWDDTGDWTNATGTSNWTVALETSGLPDGSHVIHVRAWDGLLAGESSVEVRIGPEMTGHYAPGWADIVMILVIIVILIALLATKPSRPKDADSPTP